MMTYCTNYTHISGHTRLSQRGVVAPGLFELPGQTALRISNERQYVPEDPETHPPDWGEVCRNYVYVWTYNTEYYEDQLLTFTEEVYRAGLLRLFRVRRTKNPVCIPPVQHLNKRVDGAKKMRRCEVIVMRNLARCGWLPLLKTCHRAMFRLRNKTVRVPRGNMWRLPRGVLSDVFVLRSSRTTKSERRAMPKRDLRVVKRTPIALGICERCNLQFSSNESAEDDAEAELWVQFDNHKCQPGDANPQHAKPASVGYGGDQHRKSA